MYKLKKPAFVVISFLLIISLSITGCGKKKEVVKESELPVVAAKASLMDISRSGVYSGVIKGKNEVQVLPKVSARVAKVLVKPGDRVKAGQTLILLDDSDFAAAVAQAEAALAQAKAAEKANEAQLSVARANYERTQKLYEAGAASASQLEAAKAQYDALNTGASAAAVAQAEAGLTAAKNQLAKCAVTSPISGVVGMVNLSVGDTAYPTSPAVIVSDTGELEVEIMVSESDVSYIKPGSKVDVKVSAVTDKPFAGKVESVSTVADPTSRKYKVKVIMDNKDYRLRSGMFAEVTLSTLTKRGVLCVPAAAVVPKGARTVVYTVGKDNRAQEIEVKTGIVNSRYAEILEGLSPGQVVITKGNTLVNNGTLVRVASWEGR